MHRAGRNITRLDKLRGKKHSRVLESDDLHSSPAAAPRAVRFLKRNRNAAGGAHTPTGEYFLTTVTSDPYWHWCSKCQALAYWDEVNPPGPCPAGGLHEHGSSWLNTVPRLDGQVTELLAPIFNRARATSTRPRRSRSTWCRSAAAAPSCRWTTGVCSPRLPRSAECRPPSRCRPHAPQQDAHALIDGRRSPPTLQAISPAHLNRSHGKNPQLLTFR